MELIEAKHDIFKAPDDWYLAHCISRDAVMGAGIAKEFVKRFPELKQLREGLKNHQIEAGCTRVGRVLNLVTKEFYYNKPSYKSLRYSLECMRRIIESNGIKKLAMPRIGCGLDRLEWSKVKPIIEEVFEDCDVKIGVCYL